MPNFVFNIKDSVDMIAERLVAEALLPLFHKLHAEKSGWNLSLMNIAATNMADAASDKGGAGRDISKMFKRQEAVLQNLMVVESLATASTAREDGLWMGPGPSACDKVRSCGSEDSPDVCWEDSLAEQGQWMLEDDAMAMEDDGYRCEECGATMPAFAMGAHGRWHSQTYTL
jgi:DNA polymerase iota